MTVNERLLAAHLLPAFDTAAKAHDLAAMREILRSVELTEAEAETAIDWVLHSPHSPHNREPVNLAAELAKDTRIARLALTHQRIIQSLYETHAGPSSKTCQWQGCMLPALKGLAYCAGCAYLNAGIKK